MDINALNKKLDISEKPGLDMMDPQFNDIAFLAQNGNFVDASEKIQALLDNGVYDIRLNGYFFFGLFEKYEFAALPSLIESIIKVFDENWDAFGPEKKKHEFAKKGILWLFSKLIKKLEHEEKKKTQEWTLWLTDVTDDDVNNILYQLNKLTISIKKVLTDDIDRVQNSIVAFSTWLKSFQKKLYVKEPEPEASLETQPENEDEKSSADENNAQIKVTKNDFSNNDTISVENSFHLQDLFNKLKLFEKLIEKEMYGKAAVVSEDINKLIYNFDPTVYFPKFFLNYRSLIAKKSEKLDAFSKSKKTASWQALNSLYKIDPESLIDPEVSEPQILQENQVQSNAIKQDEE